MKKVLIIGHFWPYRVGGSRRIFGLTKYFKEFGWEPIIITGPLEKTPEFDMRYEEIDYLCFFGFRTKKDIGEQLKEKSDKIPPVIKYYFLKPIYNFIREILAYPDEDKFWVKPAVKRVAKILENEKINAIISVWPVTSHIIAKELKEKYKIPWIADFPDLWSQNYYYPYSLIRRMIERKLELKTINPADVLITASQPFTDRLKLLHKDKEIYTITHGFDPETVNHPPLKLTSKFTITYTGQIYTGKQDPLKILIALKQLLSESVINRDDIEVRFYGPKRIWLDKEIKNLGLLGIVRQQKTVPLKISLKKQRESQILLLLKWEDLKDIGAYPGKIFEYLAARRPILATGGLKDVVSELLEETKAGIDALDIKDIKAALKSFYYEYKKNGEVSFKGDIEKINRYSTREMAKKFVDILNRLTEYGLEVFLPR